MARRACQVRETRPSLIHPPAGSTPHGWPLPGLLYRPSPSGFPVLLTWKGEGSLWRASEASADPLDFPRLVHAG